MTRLTVNWAITPEGRRPDLPETASFVVLNDHQDGTVTVDVDEESARLLNPVLSARQIRLGLLAAGITPSSVSDAIDAIPDEMERETARISWEYATEFERNHPLISAVATILGLTEQQIDDMWQHAMSL